VLVLGRPSLAEHANVVAAAALAFAAAFPNAKVLPALRRGNVMGALDMGLAPGLLPGRVALDDGRGWFESAWGSVPAEAGRDTTAMLEALASGKMRALVLLGADLLGDFPDRALAERALQSAELVVAVDTFLSPSSARAHVVLPATGAHERGGTTTNIEGRVTRLGQKLVAPGQCWPDWMIAAELAARLGGDLDVADVGDVWDEIERLAPSHAGITRTVLEGPAGRDGVVAPLPATKLALPRLRPFDPMGTPGIEAVERQGAPPRVGLAEPVGGEDRPGNGAGGSRGPGGRPPVVTAPASLAVPPVPARDGYAVRLSSGRRLYDGGAAVEASESLAPLAGSAVARLHPSELERAGAQSGDRLKLRSARGELVLEAHGDHGLPTGVVWVPFNLEGDDEAGVSALIDATAAVTDVRLETT